MESAPLRTPMRSLMQCHMALTHVPHAHAERHTRSVPPLSCTRPRAVGELSVTMTVCPQGKAQAKRVLSQGQMAPGTDLSASFAVVSHRQHLVRVGCRPLHPLSRRFTCIRYRNVVLAPDDQSTSTSGTLISACVLPAGDGRRGEEDMSCMSRSTADLSHSIPNAQLLVQLDRPGTRTSLLRRE